MLQPKHPPQIVQNAYRLKGQNGRWSVFSVPVKFIGVSKDMFKNIGIHNCMGCVLRFNHMNQRAQLIEDGSFAFPCLHVTQKVLVNQSRTLTNIFNANCFVVDEV